MVRIIINDIEAAMIIDTGASNTVFDKSRFTRFAPHEITDKIEAQSTTVGSSNLETRTANISRLTFGDYTVTDYRALILDLSNINDAFEMAPSPGNRRYSRRAIF